MNVDAATLVKKVTNQRNASQDEAAVYAALLDTANAALSAAQAEVADLKAKVAALTPPEA